MKTKKAFYIYLLIGIIFFHIIAFVIPSDFSSSFWIAYSFSIIAIGMQMYLYLKLNNDKLVKKSFFQYSYIKIDFVYLLLQFIFFLLAKFILNMPIWLSIVLNTFLLGIIIIIVLSIYLSTKRIDSNDTKVKEKINFIKSIVIDVDLLVENVDDEKIKEELISLGEKVKYSDPISNENLTDIEDKILEKLNNLKRDITLTNIKELNLLFEERNKKCLLYKDNK